MTEFCNALGFILERTCFFRTSRSGSTFLERRKKEKGARAFIYVVGSTQLA